jgi:hypothetical protein
MNLMIWNVVKILSNRSWKDCPVECATLFHYCVDMFMHKHILNDNGILGKVKEYVIRHELKHRGSAHAHNILWVQINNLEIIKNEIIDVILAIYV